MKCRSRETTAYVSQQNPALSNVARTSSGKSFHNILLDVCKGSPSVMKSRRAWLVLEPCDFHKKGTSEDPNTRARNPRPDPGHQNPRHQTKHPRCQPSGPRNRTQTPRPRDPRLKEPRPQNTNTNTPDPRAKHKTPEPEAKTTLPIPPIRTHQIGTVKRTQFRGVLDGS